MCMNYLYYNSHHLLYWYLFIFPKIVQYESSESWRILMSHELRYLMGMEKIMGNYQYRDVRLRSIYFPVNRKVNQKIAITS